jgi:hypothetical protein
MTSDFPYDPSLAPLTRTTRVWTTDFNLLVTVDENGVVVVPEAPVVITVDYPHKREIIAHTGVASFFKAQPEEESTAPDPGSQYCDTMEELEKSSPLAMDLTLWPWYVRQDLVTREWCLMSEDQDPSLGLVLARFSTEAGAWSVWNGVKQEEDRLETTRLRRRVEQLEAERDTAAVYGGSDTA